VNATWTEHHPYERDPIESRTCPTCFGFGSVETGVDRCGHGVSGGRCVRCGGSGTIDVRIGKRVEQPAKEHA
jgi:hypothetical protein